MATQSVENVTARNAAIARAAYDAYVTKDRAAIEQLIAEDFHFTSCGNGLAQRSALPARLSALTAAMAEVLDTHQQTLDLTDEPPGRKRSRTGSSRAWQTRGNFSRQR